MKYLAALFLVCVIVASSVAHAAQMSDYCASPPFIERVIDPNLLLMIDNSASMWDLQYVDLGQKACSNDAATVCTADSDCPAGGTCSVVTRDATFCYDETYTSRRTYLGYFNPTDNAGNTQYYQYDFNTGYFNPTAVFPDNAGACGTHNAVIFRTNTFCVDIDSSAKAVYNFVASGNFLNWLSASKFDVEKSILTGGKYVTKICSTTGRSCLVDTDCVPSGQTCNAVATPFLKPETRGCVGRKFLKQPLYSDFLPYTGAANPNEANRANVIFGVRGPVDVTNLSAVSQGGQTYINIYYGSYNAAKCQNVINDYGDPNTHKEDFISDIEACISYTQTTKNTCEFDLSQICNSDLDCGYQTGICNVTGDGACGNFSGGACGVQTAGTCTTVGGTCSGTNGRCVGGSKGGTACTFGDNSPCKGNGVCYKLCVGGANNGNTCTLDSQCAAGTLQCTTGKVGSACTAHSDCDMKWCTNTTNTTPEKFHTSCSAPADCDAGTCTSGKPAATACLKNSDCNTVPGSCESPASKFGDVCSSDPDCTAIGKGRCLMPSSVQIKSTYDQSMHSCYSFTFQNLEMTSSDYNIVANPEGCNQVYAQYHICNGGTKDGFQCSSDADCPGAAAGACIGGPSAIRAGSPVLLCSTAYAGYCATTTDNWASTGGVTWVAREYADAQTCVLTKFGEYCNAVTAPPVPDPTNDPSNTLNYQNLPSIINDIGVEGQLSDPIETFIGRVATNTVPSGLIQDFASAIRMGAMSFDFNGSATECGTRNSDGTITPATVPAFCSNDQTRACTSDGNCTGTGICKPTVPCPYICDSSSINPGYPCALLPGGITLDCPGGACILATSNVTNLDGAHMLSNSYIGNSIPLAPSSGHAVAGLINDIDNLGANSWTPFSEGFYNAIGYYALTSDTVTPLRLNSGDFNMTPVPSQFKCQKNNVLLITDGQSTADLNGTVTTLVSSNASLLPAGAHYDTTANNSCVLYSGSRNMESLAWLAQNRNIRDIAAGAPGNNSQKISTHVVYSGTGSLDTDSCNSKTDAELGALADCEPDKLMCKTARYGKGTYYLAQDPEQLRAKLRDAFIQIASSAASGTAASVLASGEGSGANLVQAIFYPVRENGVYEVKWTGRLQNFWYFIDPRLGDSTIMEDTVSDKKMTLSQDNAVAFAYDPIEHETTVTTISPGGVVTPNISLEDVHYLWETGKLLLSRTAGTANGPTDATGARAIFTNTRARGTCSISGTNCSASSDCPGTESCLVTDNTLDNFDTTNAAALAPLVNVNMNVADDAAHTQTLNLIKYIRGIDDLGGNSKPSSGIDLPAPITYQTDSGDTIDGVQVRNRTLTQGTGPAVTDVWKLGDVVNSTPKILSWVPVNTYYEIYSDDTYKTFTSTAAYKSRGMVFDGANDGMLHAFKLGLLGLYDDADLVATLGMHCSGIPSQACRTNADCGAGTCVTDSNIGQEMWAFIPKNTLPYLKYIADPNYCHIYTIDLQPFIFDASYVIDPLRNPPPGVPPPPEDVCDAAHYWNCIKSENSWRTVLIGGMRLGGACKNSGSSCQDCTKAPMTNLGYSSYFALDITDPVSPKLLWEFSNPQLGFSTSGPAIVRVKGPNANAKSSNGRWLAVFGSGPTGWISKNNNMAASSMYLSNAGLWNSLPNYMKLFVVDVATGALVATINTGEQGAFVGSLMNGTMDFDQNDLSKAGNYQDDAVYFGYVKGHVPFVDSSIAQGNSFGGSVNTMKLDPSASPTDDFYKGKVIEMWQQDASLVWHYEGAKLITGYNGATQTVTVDSNFPVVPRNFNDGSPYGYYNITDGWTRGGVKRLLTAQDVDPTHWAVSTVIDSDSLSGNADYNTAVGGAGMGPVTAAVKKLQHYTDNTIRLYFGSGRYYYRMSDILDDPSNLRALYGIIEPCVCTIHTVDPMCSTLTPNSIVASACTTRTSGNIAGGAPTVSSIGEAATAAGIDLLDPSLKGWWITLDGCRDSALASVACSSPDAIFRTERLVTDPLAASTGAIFFSTIVPTSDPCEYGGRSYLWAVKYDTGGTVVNEGILKGKAIIQRSTGEIEQIDLSKAFRVDEGGQAGERKTSASFGLTGSGGISIVVAPKPLNRILHIRKR